MTPEQIEILNAIQEIEKEKVERVTIESRIELFQNEITNYINDLIKENKKRGWSSKDVSDNWHTFGELYYHRMILTLCLASLLPNYSWKSKLHHDGTMFEDSFIVGFNTPEGQYSYHYNMEYWYLFDNIKTLYNAPEYDGHKPSDIGRLLSLLKLAS